MDTRPDGVVGVSAGAGGRRSAGSADGVGSDGRGIPGTAVASPDPRAGATHVAAYGGSNPGRWPARSVRGPSDPDERSGRGVRGGSGLDVREAAGDGGPSDGPGAEPAGRAADEALPATPGGLAPCDRSSIDTRGDGVRGTGGSGGYGTYGGGATATGTAIGDADPARAAGVDAVATGERGPSALVTTANATPAEAAPRAATNGTTASLRAVVRTRRAGSTVGTTPSMPAARKAASAACSPANSVGRPGAAAAASIAPTTRASGSSRAASTAGCEHRRLTSASAVAGSIGPSLGILISHRLAPRAATMSHPA
jgi:hypothetical protein